MLFCPQLGRTNWLSVILFWDMERSFQRGTRLRLGNSPVSKWWIGRVVAYWILTEPTRFKMMNRESDKLRSCQVVLCSAYYLSNLPHNVLFGHAMFCILGYCSVPNNRDRTIQVYDFKGFFAYCSIVLLFYRKKQFWNFAVRTPSPASVILLYISFALRIYFLEH